MLGHTCPSPFHSILSRLACLTHFYYILLQTFQFSALDLKLFGLRWPFIMAVFPCGSAGKESARNVGDLGSIPGLGRSLKQGKGYPLQYSGLENSMDCTVHGSRRSPGEWLGYPLQYSWASLVAQLVKNPPAMQDTRKIKPVNPKGNQP